MCWLLGFLHLVQVCSAVDHAAILDKPSPIWAHHLARGIVRHFDQPQRLLLLLCLRHRTVRTADIAPLSTDFCYNMGFRIDVTLAEFAFSLRSAIHQKVTAVE